MVDELMSIQVPPLNILILESMLEALYATRVNLSQGKPFFDFFVNMLQLSFGRWANSIFWCKLDDLG